jgi:CHASE1-domain containing sensor protein
VSFAPAFPPPVKAVSGLAAFIAPAVALIAGAVLTLVSVQQMRAAEEREAQLQFVSLTQPVVQDLDTRIHAFMLLARAAAGMAETRVEVTRDEWLVFVDKIDPQHDWLGFRGMALAWLVAPEVQPAFIAAQRKGGQPNFLIWNNSRKLPPNEASLPLTLMAPSNARNDAIVGFDFFADPLRRQAAEAARDLNEPTLTAPLVRLNDAGQQEISTVLVAPIYRSSQVLAVAERQAAFSGAVVLGVGVASLVERLFATPELKNVGFRITDLGAGMPLVDHAGALPLDQTRYSHQATLSAGGAQLAAAIWFCARVRSRGGSQPLRNRVGGGMFGHPVADNRHHLPAADAFSGRAAGD